MSPNPDPILTRLTQELPGLLEELEKAIQTDATVDAQKHAFHAGCLLLTAIVDYLKRPDSPLSKIENETQGFALGIPKGNFKDFVKKEGELLKKLKFKSKHVSRAMEILSEDHEDKGLQDLQIDAPEVVGALSKFRDLLCDIEVLNGRGFKVTPQLGEACFDGAVATGGIVGDLILVPAAFSGDFASGLKAVVSICDGAKKLWKIVRRGRDLFKGCVTHFHIAKLKKKGPGPRVSK
jgi:hypothetical protein